MNVFDGNAVNKENVRADETYDSNGSILTILCFAALRYLRRETG